jgi:hypothetical protein
MISSFKVHFYESLPCNHGCRVCLRRHEKTARGGECLDLVDSRIDQQVEGGMRIPPLEVLARTFYDFWSDPSRWYLVDEDLDKL